MTTKKKKKKKKEGTSRKGRKGNVIACKNPNPALVRHFHGREVEKTPQKKPKKKKKEYSARP